MIQKERKFTPEDLERMQSLPLSEKIKISQTRILEWILRCGKENVAVSFSGGKDSTVLLDMVRRIEPDIKALFVNTGLEFPEVRKFAQSKENVITLRPEIPFGRVLREEGYPLVSKDVSVQIAAARGVNGKLSVESARKFLGNDTFVGRDGQEHDSWFNVDKWYPLMQLPIPISDKCCKIMKEGPLNKYQKANKIMPIIGTMASESRRRRKGWLTNGCNAFDLKSPRSMPFAFWTDQDILNYIRMTKIPIAETYGDIIPTKKVGKNNNNGVCLKCTGRQRTGCIFCCFGAHHEFVDEGENRFQQLAKTHPKLYDYCMRGGEWIDNPHYDATKPVYHPDVPGFVVWNPKKIWVPNGKGLGYKVMLDLVNSVYGKNFIPYE